MKISRPARNPQNKQGSALIAMLAILGIMFTLFAINGRTLNRLSQHVDALNRQQTNHLAAIYK